MKRVLEHREWATVKQKAGRKHQHADDFIGTQPTALYRDYKQRERKQEEHLREPNGCPQTENEDSRAQGWPQ